jgi:hypothetical protein
MGRRMAGPEDLTPPLKRPERSGGNNSAAAAEAEARQRPRGPSCRPERSGGQNNGRRAAAPGEGADKMEDARWLAPPR